MIRMVMTWSGKQDIVTKAPGCDRCRSKAQSDPRHKVGKSRRSSRGRDERNANWSSAVSSFVRILVPSLQEVSVLAARGTSTVRHDPQQAGVGAIRLEEERYKQCDGCNVMYSDVRGRGRAVDPPGRGGEEYSLLAGVGRGRWLVFMGIQCVVSALGGHRLEHWTERRLNERRIEVPRSERRWR